MNKRNKLILTGLFIFTVGSISILKSNNKEIIKSDVTLATYDVNQLVNDSTLIISGKVVSSEVQNDFQGFPVTDYKIKVNNVFKGNVDNEVEVRTSGGENKNVKFIPDEEMASFKLGEEVTLFLTDEKGDRPDKNDFGYFVVGQSQGKLIEENGKLKNKKFEFNSSNFEKELREIEESNIRYNLKKMDSNRGYDI